ncbi:MAG: hypothetical protein ABSB42_14820 [Tepidisphaeraceae bacterium]
MTKSAAHPFYAKLNEVLAGWKFGEMSTEHSTISRTRRLIDLETHREVFQWVLKVLADYDLVSGKTVGYDATTLEANAAMRSIVRKDTKQNYQEFLTQLAKASGIHTPTRQDLAKLDRTRKNKASNDDWQNPHDPDAKITKMKDGSTHLAHKAESRRAGRHGDRSGAGGDAARGGPGRSDHGGPDDHRGDG